MEAEIIRDDDYIRLNSISDLIEDFVAPSHRARLYFLLSKPKRRDEVIRHFDTDEYLDHRYLRPIASSDCDAERIFDSMKRLGAKSRCFAFSSSQEPTLNGEVDLSAALEECFNHSTGLYSTVLLYCRKSKVGYWQGGDYDSLRRFILSKNRG